jgi:hypothetical protein
LPETFPRKAAHAALPAIGAGKFRRHKCTAGFVPLRNRLRIRLILRNQGIIHFWSPEPANIHAVIFAWFPQIHPGPGRLHPEVDHGGYEIKARVLDEMLNACNTQRNC